MILGAKEFIISKAIDSSHIWTDVEIMIEFARLHVVACKKETMKVAYVKDPITGGIVYASSRRINRAYPLSKIK